MAGIDHITFARPQTLAINRTKRRYQQDSGPCDLQDKQTFAAKERFGTAPARIDLQTDVASEVRTRLNIKGLVLHLNRRDVAGSTRSHRDFAGAATRRESGY